MANAKATEFAGQHDNRYKIRIAAQPIDGKANDELLAFIAKQFKVAKTSVSVEKGSQSKLKLVKVVNPKLCPKIFEDSIFPKHKSVQEI